MNRIGTDRHVLSYTAIHSHYWVKEEIALKYYESHEDCYRKMKKNNVSSWDELKEESDSFENFFMKEYIVIVLDRIKPVSNARVLDVGCGTGPVSCFLAQQGYYVDGIDVSRTAIEIAKINAKNRDLDIDFSVDDICSISETRSDIYDIIIDTHCMHCITYDSDRYAALTNIFRLLKKGGYFIMETMSIEDPSKWPHDGHIDEQGIVWYEVKEDYPYDKVKYEDKYWICTRRIMSPSDLENELLEAGYLIEDLKIIRDKKLNMADFQAVCRKPVSD